MPRFGVIDFTLFFVILAVIANFAFQIIRKPAEALNLLGLGRVKSISQTWNAYGSDFRAHATETMTPMLLAAMAQVESSGNPFATPEWRFRLGSQWDRIFSPLSSSVGLYQFTDGTFEQAKGLCIHNGEVRHDGPWHDIDSCWFNWLYFRVLPSNSIEMTSAYLDHQVEKLLQKNKTTTSQRIKRRLAAVIHLCGPEKGAKFIRQKFDISKLGRCGDHNATHYVKKVENYERRFEQLAQNYSGGLTSQYSY